MSWSGVPVCSEAARSRPPVFSSGKASSRLSRSASSSKSLRRARNRAASRARLIRDSCTAVPHRRKNTANPTGARTDEILIGEGGRWGHQTPRWGFIALPTSVQRAPMVSWRRH